MNKYDYKDIIQKERDFLEKMDKKLPVYSMFRDFEKHKLIVSILEKILLIHENIEKKVEDLIPLNSYLRFILETLIQSELLLKEPEYRFKLFYSVYNHQVTKSEKFVERLLKEINTMKEYKKEDNQILENVVIKGVEEGKEPSEVRRNHKEQMEALDNKSDLEFTIFTGDYKNNGYSFSAYLMETQLLPKYKARVKEVEALRTSKAKQLVNDTRLTKHFNFKRQHTKVFKLLKDDRSWEKKANEVGLKDEYTLVYDLTSSILHSTSYSLITNKEPQGDEIKLSEELIYKYSTKIINNCLEFSESNIYDQFKLINIEEEE